jgi:lysophospholipase L1-like esterase
MPDMSDIVLLVADSLGMPREGVLYNDTYLHKLKESSQEEFVDRSKRARTTDSLHKEDTLEHYNPDIIITQIGIVDCAPRYSNKVERQLFKIVPSALTNPYMSVMKRLRSRKARRQYVSPEVFKSNLKNYYERAEKGDTQIISIEIAPPTTQLQEANPDVDVEIEKYKRIYNELANGFRNVEIINPYDSLNVDDVMIDDHHPNAIGHKYIFKSIKERLR